MDELRTNAEKAPAGVRRHAGSDDGKKRAAERAETGAPTEWMLLHAALSVALLALACTVALLALFFFVVFSDFSASADFVYTQF